MAPRSTEARIAWFLANSPGGVGQCAAHSWRSLGGDYGSPPAWGTPNANAVYDAVVASGRYFTSEPPRGALVLWKYGTNGHAAISAGSGQVVTTDPSSAPYGGVGYEPLSYISGWGGVDSRRIWTDQYNGVRFDVAGVTDPVPPLPLAVAPPPPPALPCGPIPFSTISGWVHSGAGFSGVKISNSYSSGPSFNNLSTYWVGQSVVFEVTIPNPVPSDVDLNFYTYNGTTYSPLFTIEAPHTPGSVVTSAPFVWPGGWNLGLGNEFSVLLLFGYLSSAASVWSSAFYGSAAASLILEAGCPPPPPTTLALEFTAPAYGAYPDLGALPGYSTRVVPIPDATIPGIPDGAEYQIELLDPDGNVVAIGYLPRGSDPNGPFTFRVNGRFIVILYGGRVLITYLIPRSIWDALNLSLFWVGYIDTVTGLQLPDGTGTRGTPPPEGYQYILDTAFEEIIYPTRLSRVKNLYSEAIWEDANGIQAGRIVLDGVYQAADWGLNNGHTARISYDLAVRVWEAGLSRFLKALPNEVDREPLTWGASMEAWSTSDYDWLGNGLTTIKS